MVTRQQVQDMVSKLYDLESTVQKMVATCQTALTEYIVGGVKKTIPQADIDALIAEYQNLKTELKTKLSALP